jgi:hypothetical protein
MKIKEILTEGLTKDKAETILNSFVKFSADHLELEDLPKINLHFDTKRSVKHHSFGGYGNQDINVSVSNRHIMDVCRTLAHELVHYKQDINGELTGPNPGATGSPQENEANAQAAVIMRNWGALHPNLFDQPSID